MLAIPGREPLVLEHLLLDLNGTLTARGELVDGVAERLVRISRVLAVRMLSADTFGVLDQAASRLGITATVIEWGADKERIVHELGTERCVAIGNGANDAAMLAAAAIGIVVVGPEGAAAATISAADIVCGSVLDAIDLLLDERALIATLRA
jgi:P-type E1-E2 ATPase